MKAMSLGTRMRPLTDRTPKPLLKAGGEHLISYPLRQLHRAGIHEVVINTHWLGEQIVATLGSGEHFGLHIRYSVEPVLLETAGGIVRALPWLREPDDRPFLVLNGDIYCELDLTRWLTGVTLAATSLALLALVPNPAHHPGGDFGLDESGLVYLPPPASERTLTYSGIALFRPSFFAGIPNAPCRLAPVLRQHIAAGRVQGTRLDEFWLDVGTPERLAELEARLAARD
jgi:MurNAc alpha-1-phosphate uridylyltransferase